ncbi:hypothetical protein [Undibacterium fentianense]|uniref:Uncharacterized protein n=1 Tax=Undibacterium fentianense TaxID=2828728 RepID=A0A941E4R8_9BURK|nr:hypothetical protein [Undibacterium fentianense]MBR7801531.1 hypothetical protein [Undibacterium fentianense]
MKKIASLILAGFALSSTQVNAQTFNLKKIIKESVKEGQQSASKPEQTPGVAPVPTSSGGIGSVPAKEGVVQLDGLPRPGSPGLLLDSNSFPKFLASIHKPEIGGISLGMNVNDALPIIKKLNPNYKIDKLNIMVNNYRGIAAKAGSANAMPTDQFTVYFNEAGNIWLIGRHIELPKDQPLLLDTYKKALFEKYDAPNVIVAERNRPNFGYFAWAYGVDGQQTASHHLDSKSGPCAAQQYSMIVPITDFVQIQNSFRNTCAIALTTNASMKSNTDLIQSYDMVMYSPALIRDVNSMNAAQAEYLKKKAEAEEKARANKPQF